MVQIVLCTYILGIATGRPAPEHLRHLYGIDARGEWFIFIHYLSKFWTGSTPFIIVKGNAKKQLSFQMSITTRRLV